MIGLQQFKFSVLEVELFNHNDLKAIIKALYRKLQNFLSLPDWMRHKSIGSSV